MIGSVQMTSRKRTLQIFSVLFIFGGIVRLFANRTIFSIFQMEELWVEHTYFIYIYRVLGSFVILIGLILFAISKNLEKYSNLCPVLTIGFVFIGLVMMVTGVLLKLPLIFYFTDFVFCFILAWFIHKMKAQRAQEHKQQNRS
jgi:hypothetical protein